MFQAALDWYLAPWRRIGRAEFSLVLLVISLPGFVLALFGFVEGAAPWLSPLSSLAGAGDTLQTPDPAALQGMIDQLFPLLNQTSSSPAAVSSFDWSGFINSFLQLLLFPLCRMRLRDMGKAYPRDLIWAGGLNISSLNGLVQAFGFDLLPLGGMFSFLSFLGFAWLCMARSTPKVAPHERIYPPQD